MSPSFHPPAAADWPHTVPPLASVLCSLISQSLPGQVVSRPHRLWLVHSHHPRAWGAEMAAEALVAAVTCLVALTSSSQSSGKQGINSSLIPGLPSVPLGVQKIH